MIKGQRYEKIYDTENCVLHIPQIDLKKVVMNVINETDMNKSDHINLVEFKQIVSKSHDFKDNFRIKL